MKFLAFDIETDMAAPDEIDWSEHQDMRITCAATCAETDGQFDEIIVWHERGQGASISDYMGRERLRAMVRYINLMVKDSGYTVFTWNGMGFDWPLLAQESGMPALVSSIAKHHVDGMFQVYWTRGHLLGLQTLAKGLGLTGKVEGMDGLKAVEMWADRAQRGLVLKYVEGDVKASLEVARAVQEKKQIKWTSKKGRNMKVAFPGGWLSVGDLLETEQNIPDWMDMHLPKERFLGWLWGRNESN